MMVFESPPWVPKIPFHLPDSTTVGEFVLSGNRNLPAEVDVKPPLVCALSGRAYYSAQEIYYKVECVARSLCEDLVWSANALSPWDKVIGVFSVNTVSAVMFKSPLMAPC